MREPVLAYVNLLRWPSAIPAGPFTARFMSSIAEAGIRTHVIVQSAAKGFEGYDGDGNAVLKDEYGIEPQDGLTIHVIKMPHWKPASDRIVFLERAGRLLYRLKKEAGVNVVMSRDTRALPYLVRWRRHGFVTVHDTHNYYMELNRRKDLSGPRWERYQLLERKCLPKVDGILTLLEVQSELYRNYLKNNISTGSDKLRGISPEIFAAYPGLDRARPPDSGRPEYRTVLYLGSLQGKKGVDLLLEAFRQAGLDNWKLVFVGGRNSNEISSLKRKTESLGLHEKVEITGWLSDEPMRRKIEEAGIAVLPLQPTFYNRYLTAPSKLFDYLGHAIPIITSDLPSIRELAGNAALYIQPGAVDQMTQAIGSLASDTEMQMSLAKAAHSRALQLLWVERGRKTREFLSKLLVDHSP